MRRCGSWPAWGTAQKLLAVALLLVPVCALRGQDPGEPPAGRGQFAGMQRVSGEVTAIAADHVTVKAQDGAVYQIVTTPNTRMMKMGGSTFKLADLKVGDGVMSSGNLDAPNKTLHAAMLVGIDAEQMKKIAAARQQAAANMGKTLIAGRVTAIDLDNVKMTVERMDHVSQTITFDEGTSFRRGTGRMGAGEAGGMGFNMSGMGGQATTAPPVDTGESITLADIKVGDMIDGPGSLKGGVFVPKQLTVRTPRAGGRRQGGPRAPSGTEPNQGPTSPGPQ